MRIAMICYHTSPTAPLGSGDAGGMNLYVRELACALGRQSIDVDIFTRRDSPVTSLSTTIGPRACVLSLEAGPAQPLEKGVLGAHLSQFTTTVLAFAAAEHAHYDVIHSHYWLSGQVALRLHHDWRAPLAHTFHTMAARKRGGAESRARWEGEAELLRYADACIAATPSELQLFSELHPPAGDRGRIAPCGVDARLFHPEPHAVARRVLELDPDRPTILCVGRIDPEKGFDLALRALASLRHEPGAAPLLLMVGGDGESDHARWGETQRALAALRRQLGVDDQVVFCGRKSQAELRQYYNAADMVLVPSRSESFGLVALEALACGRPVLATATDGLRWVLDEGRYGHLVPCDDVDAMASAITSLLASEQERAHLATTALARARTLSWDALGTAMFDQYRILLAKQAEETPDCFGRSAPEWCLTASKA